MRTCCVLGYTCTYVRCYVLSIFPLLAPRSQFMLGKYIVGIGLRCTKYLSRHGMGVRLAHCQLASYCVRVCVCAVYFFLAFCTLQSQLPGMDLHLMSPVDFLSKAVRHYPYPKELMISKSLLITSVGIIHASISNNSFSFFCVFFLLRERGTTAIHHI